MEVKIEAEGLHIATSVLETSRLSSSFVDCGGDWQQRTLESGRSPDGAWALWLWPQNALPSTTSESLQNACDKTPLGSTRIRSDYYICSSALGQRSCISLVLAEII